MSPWSTARPGRAAAVVVNAGSGVSGCRTRGTGGRHAVKLIGVTFFAPAAYLATQSIHDLANGARPGQPPAGLAIAKRRTGQVIDDRTLIATRHGVRE